MSGLLFARGRAGETELAGAVAAGAVSIALAGADLLFAAGQQLFLSETDGGATEWLGRASGVGADSIGFSRPVQRAKSAGALLWAAASALETPGSALPAVRAVRTGVASERTRAGDWLAIAVAEPATELVLTLDRLTPAAERGVVDWLGEEAGWGLRPFTIVEAGEPPLAVRLASDDARPVKRERLGGGRARLILPLAALQKGAYQ
jgi:hypothetical protein